MRPATSFHMARESFKGLIQYVARESLKGPIQFLRIGNTLQYNARMWDWQGGNINHLPLWSVQLATSDVIASCTCENKIDQYSKLF